MLHTLRQIVCLACSLVLLNPLDCLIGRSGYSSLRKTHDLLRTEADSPPFECSLRLTRSNYLNVQSHAIFRSAQAVLCWP